MVGKLVALYIILSCDYMVNFEWMKPPAVKVDMKRKFIFSHMKVHEKQE